MDMDDKVLRVVRGVRRKLKEKKIPFKPIGKHYIVGLVDLASRGFNIGITHELENDGSEEVEEAIRHLRKNGDIEGGRHDKLKVTEKGKRRDDSLTFAADDVIHRVIDGFVELAEHLIEYKESQKKKFRQERRKKERGEDDD